MREFEIRICQADVRSVAVMLVTLSASLNPLGVCAEICLGCKLTKLGRALAPFFEPPLLVRLMELIVPLRKGSSLDHSVKEGLTITRITIYHSSTASSILTVQHDMNRRAKIDLQVTDSARSGRLRFKI